MFFFEQTPQIINHLLGALQGKRRNNHLAAPGRGSVDDLSKFRLGIFYRAMRAASISALDNQIIHIL